MRSLLLAALLLAHPAVLLAAEAVPAKPTQKPAKPAKPARKATGAAAALARPTRPVNITAQVFEVQPDAERAVWKGNVVVERDDLKITCDTLTAEYGKGQSLRRLVCDGHAHLLQKAAPGHAEREAWGDQAVFDNPTAVLVLTGSPRAREGTMTMRGEKISFFVDGNRLKVEKPVIEAETADVAAKRPAEAGQ